MISFKHDDFMTPSASVHAHVIYNSTHHVLSINLWLDTLPTVGPTVVFCGTHFPLDGHACT